MWTNEIALIEKEVVDLTAIGDLFHCQRFLLLRTNLAQQHASNDEVQFSIAWYADSPCTTEVLEAATLKKCGELGVDIAFDIVVKETLVTRP